MPLIDLHTHTTASDGTLTPAELVAAAQDAGLAAVAITDHDTVDGLSQAQCDAAIEVVPGVELSVGAQENMHILGLFINPRNPVLQSTLIHLRQERTTRNCKILERLEQLGYRLEAQEVARLAGSNENIGRPHIAQALVLHGYAQSINDAFERFLASDAPAFVPRNRLSEQDGIRCILEAGGIPILAHITSLQQSADFLYETVKRLKSYGLMGIETYYTNYTPSIEKTAVTLCKAFNLLQSGGSDFHGQHRPGVLLGVGKGNLRIPYTILSQMKAKLPKQ